MDVTQLVLTWVANSEILAREPTVVQHLFWSIILLHVHVNTIARSINSFDQAFSRTAVYKLVVFDLDKSKGKNWGF